MGFCVAIRCSKRKPEYMDSIVKVLKPRIEERLKDKSALVFDIIIDGKQQTIWFSVENKYAKYLCADRGDAFVIGLLPIAMRRGLDIVCEAPVSERLLFQLRSTLLPLLSRYGKNVHEVKIDAPVASEPIANAGGVGAGISCGVDSLHIVKNHSGDEYPDLKLTHLVLNNVGAFGETGASEQYQWTIDLAKRFCAEYEFELILTNSNIFDVVGLDFEQNHTYLNIFAVYCLQKLWKAFYYGSWGVDLQQGFTLADNELHDCAAYDVLALDVFSTEGLKIFSEGAAFGRYDKTAHIVDFEPAQKYLQVCVSGTGKNCGHCFKCKRTLLTLDALGALDKFRKVFDIDAYKQSRNSYLRYLYRVHIDHSDHMLADVYQKLAKDIPLHCRILGVWDCCRDVCMCKLKGALRPTFRKLGLLNRK